MKRHLALAAALLLVVATVWITLIGFQHVEQAPEPRALRKPRYELTGAEWTRFDAQGKPHLHATADTIRYYDDKSAELQDLNLDRLGSSPGPWHLTAPLGIAPPNEQRMQLTQPVRMRGALQGADPVEITADTLWVDFTKRELYTDSPVTLTAPGRTLDARGLRADWAGTRLQLLHDVRGTYAAPG